MKKLILEIAAVILLVLSISLAGARSQEVRLEDVPSTGLSPGTFDALPLEAGARSILLEAIKCRDYPRAETLLVREIERNPKHQELLTAVARIFFLDGKYLNCAAAMKKAEAISPLNDRDRFTLSLSYIILNHRDWARPELERLERSNPHEPLYPYWLGRLDYDAMQFKAAAAKLQKALLLDPKFMKAYDNLGLNYEALGRYDDAISVYQQAALLNRDQPLPSPWPPLNLGTLLMKLGRNQEAEVCLQESLRYDPHFPKAHFEMGLLLEKEKKDEAAVAELNLAAQYDPAYPEPHYILGRINQRLGKMAQADAEWQVFQKLKKASPRERPH